MYMYDTMTDLRTHWLWPLLLLGLNRSGAQTHCMDCNPWLPPLLTPEGMEGGAEEVKAVAEVAVAEVWVDVCRYEDVVECSQTEIAEVAFCASSCRQLCRTHAGQKQPSLFPEVPCSFGKSRGSEGMLCTSSRAWGWGWPGTGGRRC